MWACPIRLSGFGLLSVLARVQTQGRRIAPEARSSMSLYGTHLLISGGGMIVSLRKASIGRNRMAIGAGLVAVAVGALIYWHWFKASDLSPPARSATRPPVPVSVAVADRQNVPVYLTGLGVVQASYTVRVHPQVDGKLQDVLFAEGQHVKKGDVLARIDPRLFQAALDQAKAKKAQDAALLVAAEKDLVRDKALVARAAVTEQVLDQQVAKVDQLKAAMEADAAAIETAQTNLDYATITAPNDG